MFVALLLGFLVVSHLWARDRSGLFLALIAVCALQALLISLAQHYGVDFARLLQPVVAVVIPPLAWMTFQSVAQGAFDPRRAAVHALLPVGIAVCLVFLPMAVDVLLLIAFLGYGIAILMALHGQGNLSGARLQSGPLPRQLWRGVGALLILSALSDVLIAGVMIMGQPALRPIIISIFTSFTLLGVGLLSLSRDAEGPAQAFEKTANNAEPAKATVAQTELIARLDALMQNEQLYLDPDLTLARLARRLHVPVKSLSSAINKASGQNVSRYVNDYRIRAACAELDRGEPVTQAMLASGFNTKSNFNREFTRVTGKTPSQYVNSTA
ncbi:helix-turn-helix domain-containing protein [Shimia ponticola]|uniref:helix-turn-helix domain-containing protein n=1 Tax=Shimia ponticola TaxID=2582893 RepID=UPI001C9B6C49|nr:AraC family transcriptional regulator [Shimia ponticola]